MAAVVLGAAEAIAALAAPGTALYLTRRHR
jgi:hypothetical protein